MDSHTDGRYPFLVHVLFLFSRSVNLVGLGDVTKISLVMVLYGAMMDSYPYTCIFPTNPSVIE